MERLGLAEMKRQVERWLYKPRPKRIVTITTQIAIILILVLVLRGITQSNFLVIVPNFCANCTGGSTAESLSQHAEERYSNADPDSNTTVAYKQELLMNITSKTDNNKNVGKRKNKTSEESKEFRAIRDDEYNQHIDDWTDDHPPSEDTMPTGVKANKEFVKENTKKNERSIDKNVLQANDRNNKEGSGPTKKERAEIVASIDKLKEKVGQEIGAHKIKDADDKNKENDSAEKKEKKIVKDDINRKNTLDDADSDIKQSKKSEKNLNKKTDVEIKNKNVNDANKEAGAKDTVVRSDTPHNIHEAFEMSADNSVQGQNQPAHSERKLSFEEIVEQASKGFQQNTFHLSIREAINAMDKLIASLEKVQKPLQPGGAGNPEEEEPILKDSRDRQLSLRPKVKTVSDLIFTRNDEEKYKTDLFFKPRKSIVTRFIEDYKIQPPDNFCGVDESNSAFLLAFQLSVSHETHTRMATRKTWGSVAVNSTWPDGRKINAPVKVLFITARTQLSKNQSPEDDPQLQELQKEADMFKDILYVDMKDAYSNLTLKVISSLNWIQNHCQHTKFFLKVDGDTFVNIPLLVDLLLYREQDLQDKVLGFIYMGSTSPVLRYGRWKVPYTVFPNDHYPNYLSGCSYVISNEALKKIVAIAPYIPMIPIEDAYVTGLLRVAANISIFGSNGFTQFFDKFWKDCTLFKDDKLTATDVSAVRSAMIWHMFKTKGQKCFGKENRKH